MDVSKDHLEAETTGVRRGREVSLGLIRHNATAILRGVVRKNYGNDSFMGDDYTMPIGRDLAPFLLGNISRLVHSDV
jgi:hypothetical protein